MKLLRCIIIASIMMFAYNGEAVAQASKLGKAAKEVVKKAKKTKSSSGSSSTKVKPKVKVKTKECPTCKGERKVKVWNQYYGRYETIKCSRCNGLGRVSK